MQEKLLSYDSFSDKHNVSNYLIFFFFLSGESITFPQLSGCIKTDFNYNYNVITCLLNSRLRLI